MSSPDFTPITVNLVYYKQTGKYHTEASFETDAALEIFEIWQQVKDMRDYGCLPGLVEGAGRGYIISIDVPGHRNEHPRLMMP
jgi:hypothetical protein